MGKNALSFLSMKAWHPSTKKNQMKKIEAEQQYVKAKKQQEQYAKIIQQERAELEEKRRQEEEQIWMKQQMELREKERNQYNMLVTLQSGDEKKKKTRRGKRKSKNNAEVQGRSSTEILASMSSLAKQSTCDFMYMPPPGLREAEERLEKEKANNPKNTARSAFTIIKDSEPIPVQSTSSQVGESQMSSNSSNSQKSTLLLCDSCGMYGHLKGDSVCPAP